MKNNHVESHLLEITQCCLNEECGSPIEYHAKIPDDSCVTSSLLLSLRLIAENADIVRDLTYRRSLAHFEHDTALRYAVSFALMIIGDVVKTLPDDVKAARKEVPWSSIAGLGTLIGDACHRVEPAIAWEAATRHLPLLKGAVGSILQGHKQA